MKAINEEPYNLPHLSEKRLQSVPASQSKEKLINMSTENAIILANFHKDCKLRKFSTADTYRRTARRFTEYLEKQNLDIVNVDRKVLKKYLSYLRDERGLKYGSLQSAFVDISALFDYLVEEEETIPTNPVPSFIKRYLREYKDEGPAKRKFISVEEAAKLVNSTLDTRDRCILLLLLKTGMRRKELSTLDVGDVDLPGLTIVLKPTPKRSNMVIYFDYECADSLRRWLASRSLRKGANGPALFLNFRGARLSDGGVTNVVMKHAIRCGLHDLFQTISTIVVLN